MNFVILTLIAIKYPFIITNLALISEEASSFQQKKT